LNEIILDILSVSYNMRTNIFKNKIYYFILSGFLFLLINENAFAINRCTNEPVTLTWSSTNANNSEGGLSSGSLLCSFGVSLGGSQTINPTAGCTVYYRAGNASGWSPYSYSSLVVDSTRVWNGSSCVSPTGSMTFPSGQSCTISTGQSSCSVPVSWSTTNPIGTSEVTSNTTDSGLPDPGTVIYSANSDGPSPVIVSMLPSGSRTLYLNNSGNVLDTKTITTPGCEDGGWDTVSGTCRDPQVVSASIVGQYYPLGTLSLTCSGSNSYSIDVTTGGVTSVVTPVTTYSGPITLNTISIDGSYVIRCRYGSVTAQVARPYYAVPPAATVKLNIRPVTIRKDENVTVSWDTTFPTNACTLTAKVVCANNSCTAAQTAAETELNATLLATTTDFNDKANENGIPRSLQTAIKTVAPGRKDNDPVIIVADWKALGKKTLRMQYTTDLTYACSPTSRETKRIQVTRDAEQ
jgi:hypothetical protein